MAFRGNTRLRGHREEYQYSEEHLKEYVKCRADFEYWAETYAKIATLDEGIVTIKLKKYQQRMVRTIKNLPKMNKRGMIVLAPRQCGKTTGIYLYLLWLVIFYGYKRVAIVANKGANARKIIRDIKQAYEFLPIWMQPGIKDGGWSKGSIELENGSMIVSGSSTSDSIRGSTYHCVYIDEIAFLAKNASDDFMKSVLPTILSGKSAQMFVTSTPKGMNHFWKMWRKAEAGMGMFVPVRIDYTEVTAYTNPSFKKMIIETEGIKTWNQEFLTRFIGSSKTLINAETLENLALKIPPDPIKMHFNDLFRIWERPIKGATYIISVDVGKGVGADSSVAQVLRIDGMHKAEQVAVFCDNYTPINDFGEICVSIARYYNQCEIVVENNDLGGVLCERIFEKIGYDKLVSYEKDYFGIRSNRKSKAIGNIALREYVENGWIKLNDEKTISEFSFYEELRSGVFGAISGEHDDRVMSLMWALYWLKSNSEFEDETAQQINPRFRINDKDIGYEDTGMGDGDADWLGGGSGGSDGNLFGEGGGRQTPTIFGRNAEKLADHMFSDFGDGDDDDNLFGSVRAGRNDKTKRLEAVGNGYRHPTTGAIVYEDDLPMM